MMEAAMQLALDANFGSVARWHADYVACGHAQAGGWAELVFLPHEGGLVNRGSATGAADGGVPVLTLAVPGHDRPLAQIDWAGVYARYRGAVEAASEGWAAAHDELAGALLFDVRRAGVYEQADSLIPGASWRDPTAVSHWAGEVPRDRACVVYCIYGHEVGRATALRLRAAGVDARYLQGGIDSWKAAGRPTQPKPAR